MHRRLTHYHSGDNCGASYLNENFKDLLQERLKHEYYLFHNGETKESIVNRLIPKFEDEYKRRIDVTGRCGRHRIYISGLTADDDQDVGSRETTRKYFEANNMIMRKYVPSSILQATREQVLTVRQGRL